MKKSVSFTLLLFLISGPAFSDAPKTREIQHKSKDLEKIREELSRKRSEKERLRHEADELAQKVKKEQDRMRDVEKSLANTERRHNETEQKAAVSKNRHDELVSQLGQERAGLNSAAQTYYVAMLLEGPGGIAPAYGRQAVRMRGTAVKATRDDSAKENKNLNDLVSASEILRNEARKQQNKLSDIRETRRDAEKRLSKTQSRQEIVDAELKELQQSAEQVANLIESLRTKVKQEAEAEKKERAARQKAGSSPILARSLPWPTRGKITTHFGRQQNQSTGTPIISNGIIIEAPERTAVIAVSDGKVLYAGEFMGYGAMTVVEHPGDWYSVYGRLSSWSVEKGQMIKRGETVGRSRTKSGGGGAESYFELRFYGKPTDPMPWLATAQ